MLNTYFSLAASTLATFVLSPVLYEESTLQMVGPLLGQTQVSCTAHVHPTGMASMNTQKGMTIRLS